MTKFPSTRLFGLSMVFALGITLTLSGCAEDDGHPRLMEYDEKTVHESTKGVETELEEQEPGGEYLILDERMIDEKEDSRAIVHNLDGTADTLSFSSLANDDGSNPRYSPMRAVLMFGLARSFFNPNMGNVRPDPSYYKTPGAYNKSAGLREDMMSSSRTRSVRTPKGSSKGYGGGKSFRSSGG
ncbi:MAG: hypothetical protein MK081_00480 [Flavobacteriales bacterium]|nr:hypothetical protein [Flavobacteriales bacterium]